MNAMQARCATGDSDQPFHSRVAAARFTRDCAGIRDLAASLEIEGRLFQRKIPMLSFGDFFDLLPLLVENRYDRNTLDAGRRVPFEAVTRRPESLFG